MLHLRHARLKLKLCNPARRSTNVAKGPPPRPALDQRRKGTATASPDIPSSSAGAPPVNGPAQAHTPPHRTAAYPLWRTMTTTMRGVRREKKKTKRRTGCSHLSPPAIPPPLPPPPYSWPSLPPPRACLPWPVPPRRSPRRLGPWRSCCGGQ